MEFGPATLKLNEAVFEFENKKTGEVTYAGMFINLSGQVLLTITDDDSPVMSGEGFSMPGERFELFESIVDLKKKYELLQHFLVD